MSEWQTVKLSTNVGWMTLIGGDDNPNCFSLFPLGAHATSENLIAGRDYRVVNMKMGPFERVRAEFLSDGMVEASVRGNVVVLTDKRIPQSELSERWCRVCCPFAYLPEDQQRASLKRETPLIRDGKLCGWSSNGETNSEETIDKHLADLKAIGALT